MMELLESVDDMPIDIATEAMSLSGQKMSAPNVEGGHTDPIDIELATLILQLPPEKKREAVSYLRYLAAREDS